MGETDLSAAVAWLVQAGNADMLAETIGRGIGTALRDSGPLDPWRPGAHDEERLAAGGEQQLTTSPCCAPPRGLPHGDSLPAPGAAGAWRLHATVTEIDHTGDYPVTCVVYVWMRWLVPVQP